MSSLQIGRLALGPPLQWFENQGDSVQGLGGAVVSAPRTPPQYQPTIATIAPDGASDTLTDRLRIRRQLRGLLNNTPYKLGGFIYLVYSDDLEQDGWFVPDQASLQDFTSPSGLATGFWQIASATWYLAGRMRTHREARSAWLKDLRTGLYARDTLGWIYSTDFSTLAALPLTILPNGATSASDSVTGGVVSGAPLPTGRDGGICQVVEGLTDGTVLAYERPESALNLSDVIVYDRRGQITAPTTGPGTSWEEAYGPDHAWNWGTAGQPNDTPCLDNGRVRIRYDASGTRFPGFSVDVWTGSAYVEQGKVNFLRIGDSTNVVNTWVSAGLYEYTPERAVIEVVLATSADAFSRERVFITLQRGEAAFTVEMYAAPKAAGTSADAEIFYTPDGPDNADSFMFEPATSTPAAATDLIASTVTTWAATRAFSGSTANFGSLLRCVGSTTTVAPYQVTFAAVQQSAEFITTTSGDAYGGTAQNIVAIRSLTGQGYCQMQIGFVATQADQVQGAVSSWTSTQASQYRVFAEVSGAFVDKGEYTGSAVTTTSATRVEAHCTQDRSRSGALWNGARDAGQATLVQSRQNGAIVAR